MAYFSVEKRALADGTLRYRCTVGVKENGEYLHRERKTFSKLSLAKSWGVSRVADLEKNGLPIDSNNSITLTLAQLIDKYLNHPHLTFGIAKRDALKYLMKSEIATFRLDQLTEKSFIDHCTFRRQTVAASTVKHDLNNIASVMKSAKSLFDLDLDLESLQNAKTMLYKMNVAGHANIRNRRPERGEIEQLLAALEKRASNSHLKTQFHEIFMFSILTCMRIGEVTKITWDDVDEKGRAVLVRDRKDPRKKTGNHMIVPLLGDAWVILNKQPRIDERVFPFKGKSITQTFRQERDLLGIQDLRYHDLRREGASRLFEAGFSLEEVAQVTGHKSLSILWNVYREIFPQTLHDKFDLLQKKALAEQA